MRQNLRNLKDWMEASSLLQTKADAIGVEYGISPFPALKSIEPNFVKTQQYPFIQILPGSTPYESGTVGPPWSRKEHEILVQIVNTGLDFKLTQDVVLAYVQALENLLLADRTIGNRVFDVELTNIDFDPILEGAKTEVLLMSASLALTVKPKPRTDEISITQ